MSRLADIRRLYDLLGGLEHIVGGRQPLTSLAAASRYPGRGVYFFFEPAEMRNDSGTGPRVVRVGTHALTAGSRSTLHQRLTQHRGAVSGGGNHRGSIFRLLVGQALQARGDLAPCPSWGIKSDAGAAARHLAVERRAIQIAEQPAEQAVSRVLGDMTFLWLNVDDEPGSGSDRGLVERNAIALLSNMKKAAIDPPSPTWLGHASDRPRVRESGLWNQRHVDEDYDPAFLDRLAALIDRMKQPT